MGCNRRRGVARRATSTATAWWTSPTCWICWPTGGRAAEPLGAFPSTDAVSGRARRGRSSLESHPMAGTPGASSTGVDTAKHMLPELQAAQSEDAQVPALAKVCAHIWVESRKSVLDTECGMAEPPAIPSRDCWITALRVPAASMPSNGDPDPGGGPSPTPRTFLSLIAGGSVASLLASAVVIGVLVLLQDAFRVGATASGLNPGGGGPGALLMAPPAIAGLLVARWCDARGLLVRSPVVIGTCVLGVVLQLTLLLTVGAAVLPADFPPLTSTASATAMAWVVPIVVMGILART